MKLKPVILLLLIAACAGLIANISLHRKEADYWQGYVEDETVLAAPQDTGRIVSMAVKKGMRVKKGDLLFAIDDTDAKAAFEQATAQAEQAQAVLENLQTGKRPQELSVQKSAIDDARAGLKLAQEEYDRKRDLYDSNLITQRAVESAKASLDSAKARLAGAEKQLGVANLPARDKEVEAASKALEAAQSALKTAAWRLSQRRVASPTDGIVEDVIRYAGEMAGPDKPAVMLLPDGARKIRFFVPQDAVAGIAIGKRVSVACDGCAQGLSASINYVSPQAEFTPPVIYSVGSREKLVFMVEAKPEGATVSLRAGQPVDIRPVP
ncbi:MAG: biotin/lipoyl-binding protein [Alphaproteobacteria bacterium]|nr:biotin/lipoyl-binding protein [Alphaproteobacteria bacterium]